jgi:TatD DNase family protein
MAKRARPTVEALQRLFDQSTAPCADPTKQSLKPKASDAALTLDQIMLETDAPFMAPDKIWLRKDTGLGGRKNEPAAMPAVCRAVATALGVDESVLAHASTANAARFFGLAQRRSIYDIANDQ